MLLVDDLLLFVFKEIAQTADKELYDEDAVKRDLQALYLQLEGGQLSEREFERREQVLVRRLERMEQRKAAAGSAPAVRSRDHKGSGQTGR